MTTETVAQEQQSSSSGRGLMSGRAKRVLRENLTGYLFLSPALLIIFAFGIFPIFFAGYVSLYKWRIRQDEYRGLANYVTAMGDLAYLFFFLIAIALLIAGIFQIRAVIRQSKERSLPVYIPLLSIIPGAVIAVGVAMILLRFITRFAQERAIAAGEAQVIGDVWIGLGIILVGVVISILIHRWQIKLAGNPVYLPDFTISAMSIVILLGLALWVGLFTWEQLQQSDRFGIAVIRIVYMASALALLAVGYIIWAWGARQTSNLKLILSVVAATVFIAGGVWLATIWPAVSKDSDPKFYQSLGVTVWYSLLTVPVQLGVAMLLAYMLYQPIRGKGPLRIIYFIPYIAPAVATAGIFTVLFSLRPTSVANQILGLFGGEPVKWLADPGNAIGTMLESLGILSADAASGITFGPSLALLVVIFYNIWVFVGYDTVIFLAGLGNIPNTLYEAAKIDGASQWKLFRHITFPLLSPTTYFLSVISVIGTFKAFTHIYILRTPAAQGTMDSASVYFFVTFFRGARFGYSTSMAMILFVIILVLYLIQNRIAQRSVFYG
jgi:multiple sugar transport system permease protein